MLKIYYGKAKSGKTHQVFSDILDLHRKADDGSALYLIVPEQFTLEAEKQLIDQSGIEGFLGIEVVSFKRLAHKVFEEVGRPHGVKITDMGQVMLLRKLFLNHQETLVLYKNMAHKFGFLQKCLDVIKELKQNRISPSDVLGMIDKFEDYPILKHKMSDIQVVFSAYELEKEKNYFDDEDFYEFLAEGLNQSQKIEQAAFWIDGFDSFTTQEFEIIKLLADKSKGLTLTLCTEGLDQGGIFDHTNTFYRRLKNYALESGIPYEDVYFQRENKAGIIEHIAENIMTYPFRRTKHNGGDIGIFIADNRLNEVESCASKILELVRSGAYTWQDFAVITNELDGYSLGIRRIFDEYEIPYFLDVKAQATQHPIVHLIESYLNLYVDDFSAVAMSRFLKTGFFDDRILSVSAFELYVTQFGIRKKHIFEPFDKDYVDMDGINALRATMANLYQPDLDHQKVTVKGAVSALFNMMIELGVKEQMDLKVQQFVDQGALDQAQIFSQIWNTCIQMFDQLVELMGEEQMTLADVSDILISGFDAMEVGLLPLNQNHVLIGSIDRSRSHPIKVLFFLGLNDGIVPENASDKQLILDSEKAIFSEMGLKLVSDSKVFANKEQFNLYFALTRPSERMYFSYARSDAEGGALRPSYLVSKLIKMVDGIQIFDDRLQDGIVPNVIASVKGTQKHLSVSMRKIVDGFKSENAWDMTYLWYALNKPEQATWILEGLAHQNLVKQLRKNTVQHIYDMPLKTSVSRLEQYVQCPFKFFVESGLKPLPQKKYELSAPDIGVLFHSALEIFGKRIAESELQWHLLSKAMGDDLVEEIIDEITQNELFNSKFQYQYLVKKLKRVTKKAVWTLTQQLNSGAFVPEAFEVAFGDDTKQAPPIIVALNNGEKLFIRGVIDRLDSVMIDGKKYIRIIDYKSGKKDLNLSEIYHGLQMQLMVYLSACVDNPQAFRADDLYPAGAFYFKIDDPMIESTDEIIEVIEEKMATELKLDGIVLDNVKVLESFDSELFNTGKSNVIQVKLKQDGTYSKESKLISESDFELLIDHVKKTVTHIGDALMEGHIDISPCKINQYVSCQFCDFKALCQFDKQFSGNQYRKIKPLKNDEVILKLKE